MPAPYVRWLSLAEYLVALVCQAIAFRNFLRIAWRLRSVSRRQRVSPLLRFCLMCWTAATIPALAYYSFMLIFWRSEGNAYHGTFLFCFGYTAFVVGATLPPALFVLTLDRCWILQRGVQRAAAAHAFLIFAVCAAFGGAAFVAVVHQVEAHRSANTVCLTYGCLMSRVGFTYFASYKLCLGGANVVAGVLFCVLLHRQSNQLERVVVASRRKTGNFLVLVLVITDFWLSLMPYALDAVVSALAAVSVTNFIGPYASVAASLEALIGSLVYHNSVVQLTLSSSNFEKTQQPTIHHKVVSPANRNINFAK